MTNDETFAGEPLDPHGHDDALAHLRAEVERLTQERDNAIFKCFDLDKKVSGLTVKAKSAERLTRERDHNKRGWDAAMMRSNEWRAQAEAVERERDEALADAAHCFNRAAEQKTRADAAERQVATLREALVAAEEALVTFIGAHGDDGAGIVLAQVRAALAETGEKDG